VSDSKATSLSITISGVPQGMSFKSSGLTTTFTWPSPVTGKYVLTIKVTDSAQLTATAALPITIN
jgi:hypothetical protein